MDLSSNWGMFAVMRGRAPELGDIASDSLSFLVLVKAHKNSKNT
jgi:hypothetical protein